MLAAALLLVVQPPEADDYYEYPHTPVERSLDEAHAALIDASGYLCRADASILRRHAELDRQFFVLSNEARKRLGRPLYQTIRTRACERNQSGRVVRAWGRARWWLRQAEAQLADMSSPVTP